MATSLVVPVAISWACGPNRAIQLDRITYTPGQTVNVTGANFESGAAVTIKVNGSPAVQVNVNSTGNLNASFSAPSSPGTHVVTTDGVDSNGQALAGTGNSVTLTVAAPRTPAGGGSTGGGSTPGTAPQRPGVAAPAPGRTSGGANGRARGGNSRSVSGGEQLRRAVARRAPANAGINTTEGVITTRGGTTSFAGSVPRSTRVAVAARAAGRDAKRGGAKAAAGRPSERSASADLWSGIASSKNPSLMPGSGSVSSTGGGGSGVILALALLGAGSLALVGVGVAEARRRRKATAGSTTS